MTVYWTDDDQQNQQDKTAQAGRLLTWIRTLIRIPNNNQQTKEKRHAKN